MIRSQLMLSLGKYHGPENYLTNALVTLLRELLEYDGFQEDRKLAIAILDLLGVKNGDPTFINDKDVKIEVQPRDDGAGRPDIKITSSLPDGVCRFVYRFVYIEVKDRADVQPGQLVGYQELLSSQPEQLKCLTLLSRPSTDIPEEDWNAIDKSVSWYSIYSLIHAWKMHTEVGKYLPDSFIYLLEERGMSLQKVSGAYASQLSQELLQDLGNLMNLLASTIDDLKTRRFKKPKLSIESIVEGDLDDTWIGISTHYKGREFAVGVYASGPALLWYELNPKDKESPWPSESMSLTDLLAARTAENQREMLEKFLQEGAERLLLLASS